MSESPKTTHHLDPDTLNAVIDGTLPPAERIAAEAHLATCPACRQQLAELRATVRLLHGLPQYRPRRSFTLSPEQAGRHVRHGNWLGWFMPGMPVLRAITAIVTLALIGVIAADLVSHGGGTSGTPPQRARSVFSVQQPTGTKSSGSASHQQNAAAPVATRPGVPTTAPRGAARGVAPAAATAASGGGVRTTSSGHASPSAWRVAEIALGVVLFWLIVTGIGLGRMRGQGQPPE